MPDHGRKQVADVVGRWLEIPVLERERVKASLEEDARELSESDEALASHLALVVDVLDQAETEWAGDEAAARAALGRLAARFRLRTREARSKAQAASFREVVAAIEQELVALDRK